MPLEPTAVRLETSQKAALAALAARKSNNGATPVSSSDLIREAVRRLLASEGVPVGADSSAPAA